MIIERIHNNSVFPRRKRVLTNAIANLVPRGSAILDVGAGDGSIALGIKQQTEGTHISGIDVLVRPKTAIPVSYFDGKRIPFENESFDLVLFVDVLHHTPDPSALLAEAARVSKKYILVKDHTRNGPLAGLILRFMDWVGNARFGVELPYNYLSTAQWERTYEETGLRVVTLQRTLKLYPFWADWLFGGNLHFIALLEKTTAGSPQAAHPSVLAPTPGKNSLS